MKLRHLLTALLTAFFGVIGLAQETVEATKLEIMLTSMGYQLEGQEKNTPIVLRAGTNYILEFKNMDVLDHEFLWGRTPIITATGAVEDYETNLLTSVAVKVEGSGWEVVAPGLTEIELKAGQELEVYVTLPEDLKGEWEIGCFVPGHYEAGMHTAFIVE